MRYRDALVAGFFGLQESRDAYRKACALLQVAPSQVLLLRYVRTLALLISPICPHFSENVWRNVLGEKGSVMDAGWPELGAATATPRQIMMRMGIYLSVIETRVRTSMDKMMTKKKVCCLFFGLFVSTLSRSIVASWLIKSHFFKL